MTFHRKRGRITLEGLYPVAKYLGAAFVALSYPLLPSPLWLAPGVQAHRAWLMLWTPALLAAAILMDRAWLKAYRRDLAELRAKVKNGNLNRSTLLALGVPGLFLADAAAIAHLYLCWYHSGRVMLSGAAVTVHTVCMAAGMVLWVYGQLLPRVPYRSVWGIRTAKAMTDEQAWGRTQLAAVRWCCGAGIVLLALGTFL